MFLLLFVPHYVLACIYPAASVQFLKPPPASVYYGETLRIPIKMTYSDLRQYTEWQVPSGSQLELVSGACPKIPASSGYFRYGICIMNLVVPGTNLGKKIAGNGYFRVKGNDGRGYDGHKWDWVATSFSINVSVIPHCPIMISIPRQEATANQAFTLNLKNHIKYYSENIQAKSAVQMTSIPAQQAGLRFDSATYSIVGTPERPGLYTFKVSSQSSRCTAHTTELSIAVKPNLKDKPLFKIQVILAPGLANHKYSMNLLELLNMRPGFMENNQVHFRIDTNKPHPAGLNLSPKDATKLVGTVPDTPGQTAYLTLIASTNTGGDSEPLTVGLPIGYDPEQKPKIKPFVLSSAAGTQLNVNVMDYIVNPSAKPVQLHIDKVTPLAPWLSYSQTTLKGVSNPDDTGKRYQLTLRASNAVGGSSEPITVPLQIKTNPDLTPQLVRGEHLMPLLIPGQPYLYDFKGHRDVEPDQIPYKMKWADGYPNPGWIELKNNKLIVEEVPDIRETIKLYIQIENLPGGISKVLELSLEVLVNTPAEETVPEEGYLVFEEVKETPKI